jgi:hypothetical protein
MSTSPTQRTLALCRKHGFTAQVVERFCTFSKRRIDLFGVIDVVAIDGKNVIGFQTTSGSNVSSRVAKIKAEPRALKWLESGARLFVHGWLKSKKTNRWQCREIEITKETWKDTPCPT